jgi:hypothetical protein
MVAADVSRGDSNDFSTAQVIDLDNCSQVAEYRGKINTKDFGNLLVSLATEYNNALLVVENSNVGWAAIQQIINRGYGNLFYMSNDLKYIDVERQMTNKYYREERKMVAGFSVTQRTRPLIISALDTYIRDKEILIRSTRLLDELFTFIWFNGRAEAMKGYNDDEVLALTEYALERDLDIAFIEEMPLGNASDHERENTVCSNEWVRGVIASKYAVLPIADKTAGPSRYYQIPGRASRIGFISPVSHNFCGDCNRVRVTVEGRLLLCLGNEHSVDLRTVLRDQNGGLEGVKQAIIDAMHLKPERHFFYEKDHVQPVRLMNMTGG